MNCSPCQERLDERLDLLRTRVQEGVVSRADARAQGMAALQEVARDCSECESELHLHLNLRLAFLGSEPEAVAVPPELRLNVRRALEREQVAPSRPLAGRSWAGLVWTGGSILMAIGLFVIARPLLVEKAQPPMVVSSNSSPVAPRVESERVPVVEATPSILPTEKSRESVLSRSAVRTKRSVPAKTSGAAALPSGSARPRQGNTQLQEALPAQGRSTTQGSAKPLSRMVMPPPVVVPTTRNNDVGGEPQKLKVPAGPEKARPKVAAPAHKQGRSNSLLSPAPSAPHLPGEGSAPPPPSNAIFKR